MEQKNSYLSRLKFDPSLLSSFKAKYLSNIRIVLLLLFLIIATGVTSFLALPRRLNPEVKIPIVAVTTILPGASPKDVEELVTNPIEDAIKGTKGITTLNSSSNESASTIIAEFSSNISPDKAEDDLKSAVDTVTDLPEDAKDPIVRKFDFEDQPIWIFAIKSNDPASLYRFSKQLRDKLEDDSIIDRVAVNGLEDQEIQILADPEKITNNGINPLVLSSTIRSLLASYPSGNVNSQSLSFPVGINPSIASINDLRNMTLKVEGEQVKLSGIASVSEKTKPGLQKAFIADNSSKAETVATFSVYKNSSATIDEGSQRTKKIVEDAINPYKNAFEVVSITDSSHLIDDEFGNLTDSFRDTLILVFITFLIL